MRGNIRKLVWTLGLGLPVLVVASAGLYMVGMAYFEVESRSFWKALSWAAETVTTTGYGAGAKWNHPVMILFVIVIQFVGVFLIFLIIPIVLVRLLEDRFELKLPRRQRRSGRPVLRALSTGAPNCPGAVGEELDSTP